MVDYSDIAIGRGDKEANARLSIIFERTPWEQCFANHERIPERSLRTFDSRERTVGADGLSSEVVMIDEKVKTRRPYCTRSVARPVACASVT